MDFRNRRVLSSFLLVWAILFALSVLQTGEVKNELLKRLETAEFLLALQGRDIGTFCVEWKVNMDEWWEHHPEWVVSSENDTHSCFSKIQDEKKAAFFGELYNIQYNGDCSNATVKQMWSSGWGADFSNINDGLLYALESKQPVQFLANVKGWHYAARKDGKRPVCPQRDLTCYFLRISSCSNSPRDTRQELVGSLIAKQDAHIWSQNATWVYEYATRPQTWLRRAVHEFSTRSIQLSTPCTVMHVRRSDVVLHGVQARKYHPIEEYINATTKSRMPHPLKHILLLTDDQNAIEEATGMFPQYNWMYLDRPRHRGAQGGWENHIPSKDPRQEVIVLLSTLRLVRQCDVIVHSVSTFSDYLNVEMEKHKPKDKEILQIDIDKGKQFQDVFHKNHSQTERISRSFTKSTPPAEHKSTEEQAPANPNRGPPSDLDDTSTFCVEWDVEIDSWWEHHPEWVVSAENDTHSCFSRMENRRKAAFFRELYNVQYKGNCSNVTIKEIWSSGWGADFLNVNDGLLYALESKQPVEFFATVNGWHYAARKDGKRPVCPQRDMTCFFLNISPCNNSPKETRRPLINGLRAKQDTSIHGENATWAYEYATRPKRWLRRAVYEYSSKSVELSAPCAVMHVRRSDVVLHKEYARKYHPIEEYVNATRMTDQKLSHSLKSIFLLTDDQNAIEEATNTFPEYTWMYFDRPRYRGAEGGWESQIPSNDPKHEVVVLLSIFKLVRTCDILIHSTSNLADHLYMEMRQHHPSNIVRINIDANKRDVFAAKHSSTVKMSKSVNRNHGKEMELKQTQDKGHKVGPPVDNADNSTFCVEWDADVDSWWEHHPEWVVSSENDTHSCFSHMEDKRKADFFRELYNVQYNGNCSNVTIKEIWSSGWGADFLNVNDGLLYALETRQPVQFFSTVNGWHYAAGKDGKRPVCPQRDMTCFFLNISSCNRNPAASKRGMVNGLLSNQARNVQVQNGRWAYEYATRPQTWLRRAVYDYSTKNINLTTPCTAMHVRRSDVVLHHKNARKYHPIEEYIHYPPTAVPLETTKANFQNIFLLTDDQNAIEEATSKFPRYNWMYLDRPRHRGAEGGWENQIPSNDPRHEVIVLLSIFRLVKQCDTIIHSASNLADYLFTEMKSVNKEVLRIDIDRNRKNVFNSNNSVTVNISSTN